MVYASEELNKIEKQIVDLYLNKGLSIRKISEKYPEYGRTKIRNILEKYASISGENREQILLKLYNQKNHRQVKSLEEIETISKKQKETSNPDEKKIKYSDSMSKEERLNIIFSKLNQRRKIKGRQEYSVQLLERKANRLIKFLNKRNSGIDDENGKITEDQALKMLYDYPTLLSLSLNNKIRPALIALENNPNIGKENASKIIRDNPSVLGTAIERTKLQLKILANTNTMQFVLDKPRILRTSPELMYSQIKLWKSEGKYSTPFVSNKKLYELYSKKPEEILKKFKVQEEYGEDEYFDSRI